MTWLASSSPIASAAVAAGLGAFRTCSVRAVPASQSPRTGVGDGRPQVTPRHMAPVVPLAAQGRDGVGACQHSAADLTRQVDPDEGEPGIGYGVDEVAAQVGRLGAQSVILPTKGHEYERGLIARRRAARCGRFAAPRRRRPTALPGRPRSSAGALSRRSLWPTAAPFRCRPAPRSPIRRDSVVATARKSIRVAPRLVCRDRVLLLQDNEGHPGAAQLDGVGGGEAHDPTSDHHHVSRSLLDLAQRGVTCSCTARMSWFTP